MFFGRFSIICVGDRVIPMSFWMPHRVSLEWHPLWSWIAPVLSWHCFIPRQAQCSC